MSASASAQAVPGDAMGVPMTPWWLVLLQGIAAVVIGLLLITETGQTVAILVLFLGIYWFIHGVFDLVGMFVDHRGWGWKLVSGVIGIAAGLLIIRHPLWASVVVPSALVWVIGIIGIVMGLIAIISAFRGAGWGAGILGVISIVFGLILIGNTLASALVLTYVVAIWALIGGIVAIVGSFRLRGMEKSAA